MRKSSHKRGQSHSIRQGLQNEPKERKYSSVFQSGNEYVHMSSAPSPFPITLFSPEESIDTLPQHPQPTENTKLQPLSSTNSLNNQILDLRTSNVVPHHQSRSHRRKNQIYLVYDPLHPVSLGPPTELISNSTSNRDYSRKARGSSHSSSSSTTSSSSRSQIHKSTKKRSPPAIIKVDSPVFEANPKEKAGQRKNDPTIAQGPLHQRRPVRHRRMQNNFQSSVVLRHVCEKCQTILDNGDALVRRNLLNKSAGHKRRSQSRRGSSRPKISAQRSHSHPRRRNKSSVLIRPSKYAQNDSSSSGDTLRQVEKREIFANSTFLKCYQLHHRGSPSNKKKAIPTFTVRSFADLRQFF